MQFALLSIDTTDGDAPEIDSLQLFPNRESAVQKFIDDFGPEGEYADIEAAVDDFEQMVDDLRSFGKAETGEERIYIIKEVDA